MLCFGKVIPGWRPLGTKTIIWSLVRSHSLAKIVNRHIYGSSPCDPDWM